MNFIELKRHIRVWILPLLIAIGIAFSAIFWAEGQMNLPGGIQDADYWEEALDSASVVGDLMPLSGYLHHQVGTMIAMPNRKIETVAVFAFMDRVIQSSDPLRPFPDLRYALSIHKKNLLISMPSFLKLYYSIVQRITKGSKPKNFKGKSISESSARVEALRSVRKIENSGDWQGARAQYEKLLEQTEFATWQAPLMLKLAYLLYEKDPAASAQWISKLRKKRPSAAAAKAASYLKSRLNQKVSVGKNSRNSVEVNLDRNLRLGRFEKSLELIAAQSELALPAKMEEIQNWLRGKPKEFSQEKASLFSDYLALLFPAIEDTNAAVDQLTQLASQGYAASMGALLRYQAWSLAYFDAKNYRQAFLIQEILSKMNPLSPYSQIESMPGMAARSQKTFIGSKLSEISDAEPYRFEMIRENVWDAFKNGKSFASKVTVHEGKVYFVKYDPDGKAEEMNEVVMGEKASTRDEQEKNEAAEMSWIEQLFYDSMIRYVPRGVRLFKEEVGRRRQKSKEAVFVQMYDQDQFQTFILDRMSADFGSKVSGVQGQIQSEGFAVFGDLNAKVMKVSASVQGKLVVNSMDGQLMLKLSSAKVGLISIPQALLRRVENAFNRALRNSDDTAPIDILNMDYQSGRVLIQSRIQGHSEENENKFL